MLALLTLLNVASEGESARQRGEHEQQQRNWLIRREFDPDQPDACCGEHADERDRERPRQLGRRQGPLGNRDDEEDQEDADSVRPGGRQKRSQP